MIDLCTAATSNGWKVAIALAEMELTYEAHVLNLSERRRYEDWFKRMNPISRIPMIVDRDADGLTKFETGTSRLAQGCAAHAIFVEVARYEGAAATLSAHEPSAIAQSIVVFPQPRGGVNGTIRVIR